MAKVNLDEIRKRIDAGLITERKHPTADLWIYNYTPQCQFGRNWDEYTLMCRGLILDAEGTIAARPFNKFFNIQEHKGPIPDGTFGIAEKMDGSLGIMYFNPTSGLHEMATRGSFTSDQAIKATAILDRYIMANGTAWINDAYTYLFEIIYPDNRIVIDYGDVDRLVLLACINTDTGAEDLLMPNYADIVKFHYMPDITDAAQLTKLKLDKETANREGFVLRFENGLRLKFKFDEYVRLHRILTETSSSVVWEVIAVEGMLKAFPELTAKQVGDHIRHIDKTKVQAIMDKQGKGLDSLLENVPDEFYQWLHKLIDELQEQHQAALDKAAAALEQTHDRVELIKLCGDDLQTRTIAFCLLDNKNAGAHGTAWRAVQPKWSKPFATDADA
jgi:RNA ligase